MQHKVRQSYVCRYSKRQNEHKQTNDAFSCELLRKGAKVRVWSYGKVWWREQGTWMAGSELATGHGHG